MENSTFSTVNRGIPLIVFFSKRLIDIAIGVVGTMIFFVTFPIIALAIKIESRGSVIFKQRRIGINRRALNETLESKYHKLRTEDLCGKPFMLYKYRSMRTDAEVNGPRLAKVGYDDRTTRVGRWLRITHIDELPQFWNILKGDMSFIGPRPERPYFTTQYKKIIPNYSRRTLFIKPGLTGFSQITLGYDDSIDSVICKSDFDITYNLTLENFWGWLNMEIWIFFNTIFYLTHLRVPSSRYFNLWLGIFPSVPFC